MARKSRVSLSDSQRRSVYQMHLSGEKAEDIAAAYDVCVATVYRVVKDEREKGGGDMGRHEMVVAGNKKNGRLVSTGSNRLYVGTCLVGGKMRTHEFEASNARDVKEMWSQWCMEMREAEQSFMEACEPRTDLHGNDMEVVSLDELPPEDVPSDEIEEDQDLEVEHPHGSVAFVVWCKVPEPCMYGLYADMDVALAEVERMNEVSRFMGNGSAFEVDEVPWKSTGLEKRL